MTLNGILQILLFFGVLLLTVKPLGTYMARVFTGERTFLTPVLGPVERGLYKLFGVRADDSQKWTTYAFSLLTFSIVGMLMTYILLRLQGALPFNPQGFGSQQMPADLAFNTAASFTSNTNWQSYAPDYTLSYFSNMVALAAHNWMSAATGIAVALALVRGFSPPAPSGGALPVGASLTLDRVWGFAVAAEGTTVSESPLAATAKPNSRCNVTLPPTGSAPPEGAGGEKPRGIGNFYVDVTRAVLYVLLPICLVYSLFLIAQGVPQNFLPYTQVITVEGAAQKIAQGPVASQEAIKMLGTNGGGFFNANSAHPFENPSPLINFVQMLSIFLIPAALTYTFGKMVGNVQQGWALFAAMSVMFLVGVFVCYGAEQAGNPQMHALNVGTGNFDRGNYEGKETRFGIAASTIFATVTTDASCGAVNAMHDSFTPIGGLVPLFNMMAGEVIFGGVGAGLYGMLMFAILAVFIAGLMVGRTPEYLGKKIEQYEVKMAMLAVLVLAASVLGFTAIGANLELPKEPTNTIAAQLNQFPGTAYGSSSDTYYGATYNNINNSGPHGFTEMLYAYTSATGNNGSAFAGITANTPFWNITLGIAMLVGRFLMIVPLLAIAGSLANKKFSPTSAGTFPTDGGTFVILLIGVVIIVGALTYLPALALGPIVEQFLMHGGKTF